MPFGPNSDDLKKYEKSDECCIKEEISSVIWQKGESQNRGNKNTKQAKFVCFVFLLPPF